MAQDNELRECHVSLTETAYRMDALRERSGNVGSDDPLVSFLYQLMRDHMTIGMVEDMMGEVEKQPSRFTKRLASQLCQRPGRTVEKKRLIWQKRRKLGS